MLSCVRDIPSAPGYFAAAEGAVFTAGGRRLTTSLGNGYPRVSIKRRSRYVHALVCEAFRGPRPTPKHEAAHGDGNRQNNSFKNLRWATSAENKADQRLHGTAPIGENNGRALLSSDDVAAIRARYAASMGPRYVKRGTREALARHFGVSVSVINDVVAGRTWPHSFMDLPFLPPPS